MARPKKLAALRHGHSGRGGQSPTYVSWGAMMGRCYRPTYSEYARYGGRGVTVAERWHDFTAFLEDMGERPEGTSLDRYPNRDGNYEPGNVRWATSAQQTRNQSRNRIVTFEGEEVCIADLATRFGLAQGTLSSRLDNGWELTRALTTPVNPAFRRPRSLEASKEESC